MSLPPSSGVMKPKPLSPLNILILPSGMLHVLPIEKNSDGRRSTTAAAQLFIHSNSVETVVSEESLAPRYSRRGWPLDTGRAPTSLRRLRLAWPAPGFGGNLSLRFRFGLSHRRGSPIPPFTDRTIVRLARLSFKPRDRSAPSSMRRAIIIPACTAN